MNKTATDITAQLDTVIANAALAEVESPVTPVEDASKVGTQDAGTEQVSHEGKQVPLHEIPRFKEVISEKNTAVEALEQTRAQNAQLIQMLQDREEAVTTVGKIKDLALTSEDGRVQSAIDVLEAAMEGRLEEVVTEAAEAAKEGTISIDEAKKMVSDTRDSLEAQLSDQRADMLWDRARGIANSWLENLPQEYAQEDVSAVDEMFLNRVNWDAIESNPDSMTAHMHAAFNDAIQKYGEPRGALLNAIPNTETEEAEEVDPVTAAAARDKEVIGKLQSINWGELKNDGKPVVSDTDFKDTLAEILREGNRNKK